MDAFKEGTRINVLFPSKVGELSIQQLWSLPLQSKTGVDLDTLAIGVNEQLKKSGTESFVKKSSGPDKLLQLKLDILKEIIEYKQTEEDKRAKRTELNKRRQLLLAQLDKKQTEEVSALTTEQVLAQLAELDNEVN